ncbi:ABC transporter permease [Patescibacteria group bacterium]|nr:ABC transporter permease [Patescibacteria group bacterium]MBU4265296.1 ABC transporter permease [Patescibacteria group bacterium]MBU4389981.1 ABC transporter permease [Patescibacteria group bacterium]MBU4397076.1 ABC transporter permease [Patescibacteria group bacterium]MBU4430908.1 ABC transporter permease [Patescibacteria group bacterium]
MLKPNPRELLKSSFKSIFKNKTRTLLTSLGIIIGVTSVILLISIGNGLKSFINDQFESLGSNFVIITAGKIFNEEGGFNNEGAYTTFSFNKKDVTTLKRKLKNINAVIPASQSTVKAKFQDTIKESMLIATTTDYAIYRKQKLKQGRWFNESEQKKESKVVVLGSKIAKNLFQNTYPINKKVSIGSANFKVVGVIEEVGGTLGGPSFDDYIYTPLETGFNFMENDGIQSIDIAVKNKEDIALIKKETEKILLDSYDEDKFSVFDQNKILSSINTILNTLTIALTGIAAISLVVGGIGIMNIMLVSVTERTREIGLRKAVGAYPRAILLQFLFEAVILSVFGGSIGILLGSIGTIALNNFFPAKVTIESILLAFGVCCAVGIIFGVAPARRASKLSPIDALRYE